MARAYAGAAGTHLFFGTLCIAAGVAWICLMYFYEPLFVDGSSILNKVPSWVVVLASAKIYCGFWFFLTGAIGCCIKSRGCLEGVFVALNVLNVIIWVPVLLALMVGLGFLILFNASLLASQDVDLSDLQNEFFANTWLWTFPGIGVLVGVVEFFLSLVSYSMVCCCRPAQLREGYEYQYEMK
ncbi:uncharacterized protein [Watersipora subatra]|uniref:uncharacterized protein n=1 Tax=Watersipora subatra TaxID=2589382 RepID=UPI00355C1E10